MRKNKVAGRPDVTTPYPSPTYEHDKNKYDAICQWLGLHPGAMGTVALPQLFYDNIVDNMKQHGNSYVFDAQSAANDYIGYARDNFRRTPASEELPAAALECLLKNLYKGFWLAHKNGLTAEIGGFVLRERSEDNHAISLVSTPENQQYFMIYMDRLLPVVQALEDYRTQNTAAGKLDLERSTAKLQEEAYKLQAHAHFMDKTPGGDPLEAIAFAEESWNVYQKSARVPGNN